MLVVFWVKYFTLILSIFNGFIKGNLSHILCEEAEQSSTNGSFVASLGCDDDMETYSLTNDGNNQWWSFKLDNVYRVDWIFLNINSEAYQVFVDLNETTPVKCAEVSRPRYTNTPSLHQIMLCKYPGLSTTKGNIININNIGNGPLKVFEVKPIALSPLTPHMIQNFTDFWEPVSKVLDGNMETYFHSEKRKNASWILRLYGRYEIKWILISTRGGTYEVHIKDRDTEMNSLTLCRSFTLLGLKKQEKALECHREMIGDTLIIKRTDHGALRLFEVYPIICPSNHYGPNCAKCRNECKSCSPITGVCHQCRRSFYGDFCQHQCPANCHNKTCEQSTGTCDRCNDGFHGRSCDQEITTILQGNLSHILCEEAEQSSTNGSFVASLGCDDDMETYSLTNDGNNQWWSVKLDNVYRVDWIFLKINSEAYQVYVDLNETTSVKCAEVSGPRYTNTPSLHQIILCKYPGLSTMKGNIINISNIGNGPLKVFEVKPIALSLLTPHIIQNFTDFWEPVSKALDGNTETYFNSEERNNASWIIRFDRRYEMKWILLSIRGGTYEVHIKDSNTVMNSLTLCRSFTLLGLNEQKKALECHREMTGDTIIIKRTDHGALRLFEVYPILCPSNHYGPNCAKCRNECESCSPITGVCGRCRGSFYGDFCQYECPANRTCEQTTKICTECDNEQCCDQEVSTDLTSKVEGDEDPHQTTILLPALLVLVFILISVVVVIFLKRKKNPTSKTNKENGISTELHRAQSGNESELEEIPQNEADYVEEEETITVEYCNLTSQRVSIDQFISELPQKKSNGTLKKEFEGLPSGLLESHSQALIPQNIRSNRYKGIYPYDYNHVKLIKPEADENDGYANASYVHGFSRERLYIAAQGPFNPKTLEDFWTVIWQNDSTRIVMLTNLYEGDRMKCLKYWPDTELDIGPYTIRLDTVDVFNHYILRYLVVQYQEDVRRVTQFHFTTWPDNSIPEDLTSVICFRNLIRNGLTSTDGPIVVHCSAGIGRTGTFISLDYLLEEGAAEQTIDVKGYVASLRHQRGNSVQTCEQYLFLHDALKEGLTNNAVRQSCLSVL